MSTSSIDKATFLLAARLRHISEAFSEVHWGPQATSTWQGTADVGELCFDNGCGDALAAAWNQRGLVGLAFDHELENPPLNFKEHKGHGFFAGIPEELFGLVGEASQWAGGEFTSAFWTIDDGPLQGSWHEAIQLVLPSTNVSFGLESLQEWALGQSLDLSHMTLALRLATGPWGVVLKAHDTAQIVLTPADAESPPDSDEGMERAAEILGEVGVRWVPPLDLADANRRALADQRRVRAVEELGELSIALFESVRAGDVAAVEKLLAAGANVDTETVDQCFEWTPAGDTPLLQAIKEGHEDVVETLLASGASVGHVNSYGQSEVYWAVRMGMLRTINALRTRGADLDDLDRPDSSGWTLLHWAAADGFEEIVLLLLDIGVQKDPRNDNGHRPLDVARLREQSAVIRLLEDPE